MSREEFAKKILDGLERRRLDKTYKPYGTNQIIGYKTERISKRMMFEKRHMYR